jgi:ABC-2 type transport system permease protein
MKTYWDVFKTTFKNNLVREFIYRSNTIAITVTDCIWLFVELAFFEVIYSNTLSINGWTRDQVFFFLGVFTCCDTLFTVFFQRSFWMFPYLVNQGDLDVLLTKPVSPIFLATFKDITFSQIFNLCLGLLVIHKYGEAAGFLGGIYWLALGFWMIVGLATQYMVRLFFVIWVFWLERGLTVSRLYYQFYALANKPEALYPTFLRYLLKTALPFAFLGNLPAQALMGKGSPWVYLLMVVVLSAYGFMLRGLWKMGLRRYQSASS